MPFPPLRPGEEPFGPEDARTHPAQPKPQYSGTPNPSQPPPGATDESEDKWASAQLLKQARHQRRLEQTVHDLSLAGVKVDTDDPHFQAVIADGHEQRAAAQGGGLSDVDRNQNFAIGLGIYGRGMQRISHAGSQMYGPGHMADLRSASYKRWS